MTTTITLTGDTPEAVDKAFKAAWTKATPKGAKAPPADVVRQLHEAQRSAHAAIAAATKKASRGGSTRPNRTMPDGFVLTKNGAPLARHSLSFMAWAATTGIDGAPRVGVDRLLELLAAEGVTEPTNGTPWTVTLPNGAVVAAGPPGYANVPAKAAKPAKPAAKKATTKASSKPAKKATTQRSRKDVTPRPKGSSPARGRKAAVAKAS